jgi:hypothetical protein
MGYNAPMLSECRAGNRKKGPHAGDCEKTRVTKKCLPVRIRTDRRILPAYVFWIEKDVSPESFYCVDPVRYVRNNSRTGYIQRLLCGPPNGGTGS